MNADKHRYKTTPNNNVVLSEAEKSYSSTYTKYRKQNPSTSLRHGQDSNQVFICVHLRPSVDK